MIAEEQTGMKKLTIAALLLLAGCTAANKQEETAPKFMIDTPFGREDIAMEAITPDVYAVVATRATNKMLDQTTAIYEQQTAPKLYLMQIKKSDPNLPDGFYYARQVSQEIIEGSSTYTVVNNLNDADYYLEVTVSPLQVEGRPAALQYKMVLFDKQNVQIDQWAEVIQQVQNDDRSWW